MEWFLLLFNHMTDLNQSNEEQYFGNGQQEPVGEGMNENDWTR